MAVASVTWQKNKAQELASAGGLGGYTVYNLTVDGDHTFFVGNTGGGTWVHNACPIKINVPKQANHLPGTALPGKSILTDDPNAMLSDLGTGQPVIKPGAPGYTPPGEPGYKERIDFGRPIGIYYQDGIPVGPTNKAIAHYGGKGIHFVPSRP